MSNWKATEPVNIGHNVVATVNSTNQKVVIPLGSAPFRFYGRGETTKQFPKGAPPSADLLSLWDQQVGFRYQHDRARFKEFRLKPGDPVPAGYPLGEIGRMLNDGRLHFEIYPYYPCIGGNTFRTLIVAEFCHALMVDVSSGW